MTSVSLSMRDINVLEKIRDPEFDPASSSARIDPAAPVDPHITDPTAYQQLAGKEREIVNSIRAAELELEKKQNDNQNQNSFTPPGAVIEQFKKSASDLGDLIEEHPNYASARNNRAQALRRLYGDALVAAATGSESPEKSSLQALIQQGIDEQERIGQIILALADLDKAIDLLTQPSPWVPISPTAAKTLSSAHTQRAAIYHATTKLLQDHRLANLPGRREAKWTTLEFEAAASRDFALGGRYGNEIARGLAVSTNPMAKLCGEMVQEMMRREYGNENP